MQPLILFYFFAVVIIVTVICILASRNLFYATLLLIVCLIVLAGVYVLAFAEMVAVTQMLIYAGGILVIMLFAIMLSSRMSGKPVPVSHTNTFWGIVLSASLFIAMTILIHQTSFPVLSQHEADSSNIPRIGVALMTDYLLPFEVAGVLLLVSLIGAAVIASSMLNKEP
jgi:NADH-quinone oxidoreductase subunit J